MYTVDRLVKLFMQQPGRPLKWPVVDEFDVNDGGVSVCWAGNRMPTLSAR